MPRVKSSRLSLDSVVLHETSSHHLGAAAGSTAGGDDYDDTAWSLSLNVLARLTHRHTKFRLIRLERRRRKRVLHFYYSETRLHKYKNRTFSILGGSAAGVVLPVPILRAEPLAHLG